jgi:N-acetyl-alpha-D-muramate 1-phosphate uridylyltransferase
VPNPAHKARGDFGLLADGTVTEQPDASGINGAQGFTYSTIGLYKSALFAPPHCAIAVGNPQGAHGQLAPTLRSAMRAGRVTGEVWRGEWTDVGTPERLAALNTNFNA